jgi:hypothetical protein
MSYAAPGQPAEPKTRPATVTAATWLLLGVAAVFLLTAVLAIGFAGTFGDIYEEAYAGTDLEDIGRALGIGATVGGAVVNLLFAAGFVVLALLDYRGKNPARIVTWVVGGLALCCTGVGLLTSSLSGAMGGNVEGGPSPAEIQRMLEAALPGWYFPLSVTLTALSLLALLVAVILLALPPSNEFFRKPAPPAEPPPPYPSAPSAPS